jgi:hypothetical protein
LRSSEIRAAISLPPVAPEAVTPIWAGVTATARLLASAPAV